MSGRMALTSNAIMCGWCHRPVAVQDGRISDHDTYVNEDHNGAKIAIPIRCSNSGTLTPFDNQVRYDTRSDETIKLLREIRDELRENRTTEKKSAK